MTTAFAPLRWYWLAIPLLGLLLLAWLKPGISGFLSGFLFGLGLFGAGVSWVYVSMVRFGGMAPPLAVLAVLLFVAYLSLFPALTGFMVQYFCRRVSIPGPAVGVIVFAPVWTILEYLRAWLMTGFPWLNIGYSQSEGPLAGFAPVIGVYGLSWLCALSAALLVYGLFRPARGRWLSLTALLALLVVGWLLRDVEWVEPQGRPLRVAMVQANVPLAAKWNPENNGAILARYLDASAELADADVVIWPESAAPMYTDQLPAGFLSRLASASSAYLFGIVERESVNDGDTRYYNSVMFVDGEKRAMYRKRHLVPFGEFLPLRAVLAWLLDYLHIPMSNFSAGTPGPTDIQVDGVQLGISICYEDAFQRDVLATLPDSEILVNVSEDAWFGDSLAPHQRIQMAQIRAMESGRPMIRAANTGVSAIIDERGRIRAETPQFVAAVLQGEAQGMQGLTPFVRFGNGMLALLVLNTNGIGPAGAVFVSSKAE